MELLDCFNQRELAVIDPYTFVFNDHDRTTALPATGPCLAPQQQAQPSVNGPAAPTSRAARTSTSASAWTFRAWGKCWLRTSSAGWRSDVHYLIGILTEGETRHQARANAVAFADELVTRGEFDYYDK